MSSNFLSCDWGTSHFRLRLVDDTSLAIHAEVKTNEGISRIFQQSTPENRPQQFAEALTRHIRAVFEESGRTATSCIISGMASSNIGWFELPYAVAPLPLSSEHLVQHRFTLPSNGPTIQVTLVSGIRTEDDVMRGEECELLGLLELHPALGTAGACVILPGTHSKHIHLEASILQGFVTHMTGELFAHLRGLPTLKAPLAVEGAISETEFAEGVHTAQKFGLPAGLFKIRTRSLISPLPSSHAPSFLSGLLIGTELLGLRQENTPTIFLSGSPEQHPLYLQAGEQLGLPVQAIAPEILRRALLHAHRSILLSPVSA